jgi:WD40 repeat protein
MSSIPQLPIALLVHHIFPYCGDRPTWNALASTCRDVHQASRTILPPWPEKTFAAKDVRSVVFSPDGIHLAVGCYRKYIHIYDRFQGHVVTLITQRDGSLHYSPCNGRYLIFSEGGTLVVWDMTSFTLIRHLHAIDDIIWSVGIGSSRVAASTVDGTIFVWNLETGQLTHTRHIDTAHLGSLVRSLTFAKNESTLVSSMDYATFEIWDLETNRLTPIRAPTRLADHQEAAGPPQLVLPNGRGDDDDEHLVVCNGGGNDFSISEWEIGTTTTTSARSVLLLQGHLDYILGLCATPDGRYIASASIDGTIRVWDRQPQQQQQQQNGTCIATFARESMHFVQLAPDGSALVGPSCSGGFQVKSI